MKPPKRVAQKIERLSRRPADPRLLLVDRKPQLARHLMKVLQGLFGLAFPTQNYEIVCVDHKARAQAFLQPKLLPPQHQPAHIQVRQQR